MKIIVLGLSCSGKSTFSDILSNKINIPVYHLDHYYWKKSWKRNPKFNMYYFVKLNEYILDGNYFNDHFYYRVNDCDYIIYINCNIFLRILRMTKRHYKFIFSINTDKNPISEKINIKFIFITIYKQLFIQPKILSMLKSDYQYKTIYIDNIKNVKDYDEIISKLL